MNLVSSRDVRYEMVQLIAGIKRSTDMDPKLTPDLTDKIVYLYQENREHELTLQNPTFEAHNGRLFLVGEIPEGGSANDWLAGLKAYVSWDHVQEFIVFNSLEDYYARLSRGWSDERLQ